MIGPIGEHNDQPATKAAGRSAYGKLLEGGVEVFEYDATMIHAKTMVVDGLFAMFGSSNLDARSSQINEELDITVSRSKISTNVRGGSEPANG